MATKFTLPKGPFELLVEENTPGIDLKVRDVLKLNTFSSFIDDNNIKNLQGNFILQTPAQLLAALQKLQDKTQQQWKFDISENTTNGQPSCSVLLHADLGGVVTTTITIPLTLVVVQDPPTTTNCAAEKYTVGCQDIPEYLGSFTFKHQGGEGNFLIYGLPSQATLSVTSGGALKVVKPGPAPFIVLLACGSFINIFNVKGTVKAKVKRICEVKPLPTPNDESFNRVRIESWEYCGKGEKELGEDGREIIEAVLRPFLWSSHSGKDSGLSIVLQPLRWRWFRSRLDDTQIGQSARMTTNANYPCTQWKWTTGFHTILKSTEKQLQVFVAATSTTTPSDPSYGSNYEISQTTDKSDIEIFKQAGVVIALDDMTPGFQAILEWLQKRRTSS